MAEIYEMSILVLRNSGELQTWNIIRVAQVYEDDKMRIIGVLDREARTYEVIYVELMLSSAASGVVQESKIGFGIPKSDENRTLVYHGIIRLSESGAPIEAPLYHRPGRWEKYLEQLYNKLDTEANEFRQLHRKPIDDSSLFPDIEL